MPTPKHRSNNAPNSHVDVRGTALDDALTESVRNQDNRSPEANISEKAKLMKQYEAEREVQTFGTPHHTSSPKHNFRPSTNEDRTKETSSLPPSVHGDTQSQVLPPPQRPNLQKLRQEKKIRALKSIETLPERHRNRRAGRHKKGPKHQFGLQKGWRSPRNSRTLKDEDVTAVFGFADPETPSGQRSEDDRSADQTDPHPDADDERSDSDRQPTTTTATNRYDPEDLSSVIAEDDDTSQYRSESEFDHSEWEKFYDDHEQSYFYYNHAADDSIWEEDVYVSDFLLPVKLGAILSSMGLVN